MIFQTPFFAYFTDEAKTKLRSPVEREIFQIEAGAWHSTQRQKENLERRQAGGDDLRLVCAREWLRDGASSREENGLRIMTPQQGYVAPRREKLLEGGMYLVNNWVGGR